MYYFCLLLGFLPLVVSELKLLEPCFIKDMECLSHSTEQFLENTCRGIPKIDVKPIDPLTLIEPFSYEVDKDMKLIFHFKNLNITGLRHQKISDFQMNRETKSVLLKTQADLNIVSDIDIELQDKKFSGVYTAVASVYGIARYNYDFENREGVEYFIVGPETLTCEMNVEPTVTLNYELTQALANDPVAKTKAADYSANKSNYRKQTVCKIAEKAYVFVVHNIRAVAKVIPKTAFFKDI